MEKLHALLAGATFDHVEDEGDEEIALHFTFDSVTNGVIGFIAMVELDALNELDIRHADGSPVSFAEIYQDYDRDENGEPIDEEEDDDEDDRRDV
jgi:hypothetical protein